MLALLLGIGFILLTRSRLLPVRSGGAQAAPPGVEHQAYRLDERLFEAVVPADSQLAGQSLLAAGIGEAFGIAVLAIEREGNIAAAPAPSEVLLAGDYLLLGAREADIDRLRQVHGLQVQDRMRLGADALRAGSLSMTELVLRPRSELVGQTLEDIDFRDRFGSTVLGIWRDGAPRRTRLAKLALEGGDALLVHGPPVALRQLRDSPDFVVLTEDAETAPRARRAPLAVAILVLFVLGLMLNVAPVAIMGVAAAAVMVLTGCVTMDDARSAVEWRAILLIAAMLPLAEAMQTTGTAAFLAERSTESLGAFGALPVLAGVLLLTFFFTHIMGNHVTAVLMAPLAIDAAVRMGADPAHVRVGRRPGRHLRLRHPLRPPRQPARHGPRQLPLRRLRPHGAAPRPPHPRRQLLAPVAALRRLIPWLRLPPCRGSETRIFLYAGSGPDASCRVVRPSHREYAATHS